MKLVVAIDSAESAKSALDYIVKENYPSDTQVYLVHVIVPGFADGGVEGIPDNVALEKRTEQALLNNLSAKLEKMLFINAKTSILVGHSIAEVIAQACQNFEADAVVVPSHARKGFSRIWFGSVADDIVDEASCTVIVLKMLKKTVA